MHNTQENWFPHAFDDYLGQLHSLVSKYPSAKILELGGGRTPSFTIEQMPNTISSYTVNDISADELSLTGDDYEKACFDVTGDVSDFFGKFDVIFSRQLIEHVNDGLKMHENVRNLLRPGGVAFHMAPTLYALPFVVNKFLPEDISDRILYTFFPSRRSTHPKFKAYYSWCFGNRKKMSNMLSKLGYGDITIKTFYGHDYYRSIPILREVGRAFSNLAAKKDWSTLGSYSHIIAYNNIS